MSGLENSPLFGAAILKLSFIIKNLHNTPGYKFIYNGTLRKLEVTDLQVDEFIEENREILLKHIEENRGSAKYYE
ncbi:MAG: hypothetical protein JXR91_10605 [Deltaproteobacteria bacterium]|nr:hypothetical protein [Deltaproteobacteria bacterium]